MNSSYSNHILPTSQFEESFQVDGFIKAMEGRWTYTIPLSLCYLSAVQYGQKFMESKSAWNLRIPLICWSAFLALFSWLGTIRITVFLILTIRQDGIFPTICGIREKLDNPAWLWLYLFVLSKLPELGDTAFIVLRKTPLSFLHWYHHITVFIYSFYMCAHPQSGMIWYAGMNFAVHALMYTYYTLRAARCRLPERLAIVVTGIQISQMVVGVMLQLVSWYMLHTGYQCDTSMRDILFGMIIYTSYMVLFADFFYKRYLLSKSKKVK